MTLLVLLGLVSTVNFSLVPSASAQLFSGAKQEACEGTQLSQTDGSQCVPGEENRLNNLIAAIINLLSIVIGIVAVVMIIVNGLRFITSGGDSNAVGNAKRGLLYAIIGLVIVVFAQFIVRFVLNRASV